ncbi:MAG: sodium:solute symporter family protein, partial [Myxococcota bacterium]
MGVSQIDLWIVGAYFLVTIIIGIACGRNVSSMKDFAVGKRSFGGAVLVSTMFATEIGGGSTLRLNERVFQFGLVYVTIYCAMSVYRVLAGWLVIPRMGSCIERAISSGDIMEHFYGKLGKVVAGSGAVLICIGKLAAQILALGVVFEVFLQLPASWGVWLGAGVVLFYASVGGMLAITATDVFQFAVLLIAIPLLCIVGLQKAGGIS